MISRPWHFTAVAFSLLLGFASGAVAESKSLKASISWDGEGRVFLVGPETILFLGALEGVMYVETSDGHMDEGFVECPLSQRVDITSATTSGRGHCMIIISPDDTVFADWTCEGKLGRCHGDLVLTGGTGKYKGITGASKLLLRSPLHALVGNIANGRELRVQSGLAVLPELRYELATGQ